MYPFGIEYTKAQALFKKLAVFDFESKCFQEKSFNDTDTTNWIGKHIAISVSISSNLVKQPIVLCSTDPHYLVATFIAALENVAPHCKVQMKTLFLDIETAVKIRMDKILETLSQRNNRRRQVIETEFVCFQEDGDISCASTQFLQLQKNQLIDLQEQMERYCNVLTVFGFNSEKNDINLIRSYLLPILINGGDIEPVVIKKLTNASLSSLMTFNFWIS